MSIEGSESEGSSEFISQPEIHVSGSESRTVDDMDASIASIRQSLANLRTAQTPLPKDTEFHNSTIDTTYYNDTKYQLDEEEPTPFMPLVPTNTKPSWRKLRPASTASTYIEPKFNSRLASMSTYRNVLRHSFQLQDASTTTKVDDLHKQITSYKIQIKFFKQFLQNLIDKTRESGLDLDVSELTHFQRDFAGLSPYSKRDSEVETKYNALLRDYDEVFKLNEDLYENLEGFQHDIQGKEKQLHQLNDYLDTCTSITNEVLQALMENQKTDRQTRQALQRCLNTEGQSLELKLHAINLEINKILDTSHYPTPPTTGKELEGYLNTIKQLRVALQELEADFQLQKSETRRIETELMHEVEESKQIRQNYQVISQKFSTLCTTLEKHDPIEMERLRSQNSELIAINRKVDDRFNEYRDIIDSLQEEVNAFKKLRRRSSRETAANGDMRLELESVQKEYAESRQQLEEITAKYTKLKDDSTKTISKMSDDLNYKQVMLKSEEETVEKLKKSLHLAVSKSEDFEASVDLLNCDKESLLSTIRSLTVKLRALSVDGSSEKENAIIYEYQFKELLQLDLYEFQKLLKSFSKIMESLKEPTKRIENLSKTIFNEASQLEDVNNIREQHRTIFEYFAKAVDMIVNDHVDLLLKENEYKQENDAYIEKLNSQIKELQAANIDTEPMEIASALLPISRIKKEELHKRWKEEREARVHENKEASNRLRELENDNQDLQQDIRELTIENARLREALAKQDR